MNASQQHLPDSYDILAIAREVISLAHCAKSDRPSSRALLAFAVRLAGSWKSTVTLVKHHPEQEDLRAISNDCAVIQRSMYDAMLQMRWIALGPNDSDKMGQLYLDFQIVENYKLMEIVLSQDDAMSRRVANSPLKDEGHSRLTKNYNSVKDQFPKSDGKGVRNHWYPGSLADLAKDLRASEEYTWFVRRNNSSVHTGPLAMFNDSEAKARHIELIPEWILCCGLGVLARHDNLALSDLAAKVIAAHSTSLLSASFDS